MDFKEKYLIKLNYDHFKRLMCIKIIVKKSSAGIKGGILRTVRDTDRFFKNKIKKKYID